MQKSARGLSAIFGLLLWAGDGSALSLIAAPVAHFDEGRSEIPGGDPRTLEVLQSASEVLKRNPSLIVSVEGHADASECAEEVLCATLSERRAKAVYEWLLVHGASQLRVNSYKGLGSSRPVDRSDTEEQRSENRRVELMVVEDSK